MTDDIVRVQRGVWPGPALEPDATVRALLPQLGHIFIRYGGATGGHEMALNGWETDADGNLVCTGGGQLLAGPGVAAAPGISVAGHPTKGLYWDAVTQMPFAYPSEEGVPINSLAVTLPLALGDSGTSIRKSDYGAQIFPTNDPSIYFEIVTYIRPPEEGGGQQALLIDGGGGDVNFRLNPVGPNGGHFRIFNGPAGDLQLGADSVAWRIAGGDEQRQLAPLYDNGQDIGDTTHRVRNLYLLGGLQVGTKAGTPTDDDAYPPADGMLFYDATAHKLYIRESGAWTRSVTFA